MVDYVDVVFKKLQSLMMLALQQQESSDKLCQDLRQICYVTQPIFTTPSNNENEECVGDYSLSLLNAIRFIKDQGTFTVDKFDALDPATQTNVA